MTHEAAKELDRRCVWNWLCAVYRSPSIAYYTYSDEQQTEFAHDALVLLKEQEPKPVKVVKTESDYKLYYCPRCDRPFCDFYYVKPKFCDKCGQAVKWE